MDCYDFNYESKFLIYEPVSHSGKFIQIFRKILRN